VKIHLIQLHPTRKSSSPSSLWQVKIPLIQLQTEDKIQLTQLSWAGGNTAHPAPAAA
jgi:hypothetical protein